MHVRWLEVVGFRNHGALCFEPAAGVNALTGGNGQGKTSILEAIHVLLTGRSFRTARLGDCIAWDASETVVRGDLVAGQATRRVELRLVARPGGAELQGTPGAWVRPVAFSATDVALVTGMPQVRRAYLDTVAARLTPAHGEACRRYRLVLQQRTHLLADLATRADAPRLLGPWDEQLAALGADIVHRRLEVLAILGVEAAALHDQLAPATPSLRLTYATTLAPGPDRPATRDGLRDALAAARPTELRRGVTLVGPHRDDVAIHLGRAEARIAASRGEQRRVALALRLAEAAISRRRAATPPILLLDDVLAELDAVVREHVLARLVQCGQVVFSTTEAERFPTEPAACFEVRDGGVRLRCAPAQGAA